MSRGPMEKLNWTWAQSPDVQEQILIHKRFRERRDLFAAAALSGLLAACIPDEFTTYAEAAWTVADIMLEMEPEHGK